MNKWGIRKRVLVLALLPAITIALILGLVFTHTKLQNIDSILTERGASLGRQLAVACEFGIFTANRNLLSSLANSTLEEKDVRSLVIFDRYHRALVQTGPKMLLTPQLEQLSLDTPTHKRGEESSLFIVPVRLQNLQIDDLPDISPRTIDNLETKPIGWLALELSHANSTLEKYQTLMTTLILVSIGVFINWIIAIRITRGVIDPLEKITQAVTAIREGKLDTRVYTQGGEELQVLETGINSMAESLSKAYDEMQHNIDQATEDLRETLETIEIQNIELDIARKEALEASRIKSEFLANMSHEIRTPLNGILGFTNLLLKGQINLQQKDHLSTIKKSSEILLTIINDILDFSKIEAGKLVLDRSPLKLREIVEDVMVMLAPAAHQKNLDLVSLIYSDVPNNLMGDPLRIKQIITNLVNNAIKFTQSGEVVLRVMVEDEDESGKHLTIRIRVSDTGVGLSRAQQQSLFNAFAQADATTARQYGGTGLGLVISKRLVEEMGGEIGLESELGKGSSFWFTLKTELASSVSLEPSLPKFDKEKVIYLESQSTTGLAVKHLLEDLNLAVTVVESPVELVKTIIDAQSKHQGFELAIIGLSRHMMNSNQYRITLRELEYNRDCRTLLLTPTLDDSNQVLLEICSGHLTKPLQQRRLHEMMLRLLHGEEPSVPSLESPQPIHRRPTLSSPAPLILAVDDNDANLKLVEALLSDMMIKVHTATNGFEALSKAKQVQYDLIFMDVQMPGMDGIEATERIRACGGGSQKTPIIALTAHALADEKKELLNKGFDDYLTKPVSENQLQEVIQQRTDFNPTLPTRSVVIEPQSKPVRRSRTSRLEKCVDIEQSIKLAAGKADLAEELFSMLLENLPADLDAIKGHYHNRDMDELLSRVHKLHGATRYCGVPEMRRASESMETALKQKEVSLDAPVNTLLASIEQVLVWSENNDWQNAMRKFSKNGQSSTANAKI
ncbi:MAG: response regulator [Hahellaceae bacterium]|nr:response regulator [Hahellaceae bacterium]